MAAIADLQLHRPDPTGLVRGRLLSPLLDESGPGVVVVIAPPGSGKTTLMARAADADRAAGRAAAWCTAGPEDSSGPVFLEHLTRALSLACGSELPRVRDVPALMDAVLGTGTRRLTAYLDDAHELERGTAEAHLESLVRWRPHELRLVIGTRRPPSLNLPRLMVSGELLELDAEALRFRSWEVEELFRVVYREPLPPEAAAALTRRTGGWAAGLVLFHLATEGKPPGERVRAVDELGGRSRLLRSYLTRTVLDELEPSLRDFLLRTSTLGTLTGALCDALLGREGSAAVLADLAERQFFVVPSEDGSSYHSHQVMQTLLEGMLVEEVGAERAVRVYARSGALLEAAGLPAEAARAYALAMDNGAVARLVQQAGPDVPIRDLDDLGDSDDPWLALARARRLARSGSVSQAVAAFRRAESLVDDHEFRRRCQDERADIAVWLPDTLLPPAEGHVQRRSTSEALRRLTRQLRHDQAALPPLARIVADVLAGHPPIEPTTVGQPLTKAQRTALDLLLGAVEALAAVRGGGDPDPVMARLEQVVLTSEVLDQPWLARLGRGLQAVTLCAVTRQPWRVQSCVSLVAECEAAEDGWGAGLLAGATGWALARRGDPACLTWLDRAERSLAAMDAPVLRSWVALVAAEAVRVLDGAQADAAGRRTAAVRLARGCGVGHVADLVEGCLDSGVAEQRSGDAVTTETVPSRPAGPEDAVSLRCLGTFAVTLDGRPQGFAGLRPLPRSLLLLLAMRHGRDVHRETLIDAFWPESSVDAAAHRLHAAASSVRRALVEAGLQQALVRRGSAYRLDLGHVSVDVTDFEDRVRAAGRAMSSGDHAEALRCSVAALDRYGGDLLPEAGPQEWVVDDRARLRAAAADTAGIATRMALRLGQLDTALAAAQRATDLDPLRDSAWALLAEVQTRLGDVTAAAATRRRYESVTAETAAGAGGPFRAR